MDEKFTLKSVGVVRSEGTVASLILYDKFISALKEIHHFSHIIVAWQPESQSEEMSDYVKFRTYGKAFDIEFTPVKIKSVDYGKGQIYIENYHIPDLSKLYDIKAYFPVEDRVKSSLIPDDFSLRGDKIPETEPIGVNNSLITEIPEIDNSEYEVFNIGEVSKDKSRCYINLKQGNRHLLDLLKGFSHIQVIWWFSRFDTPKLRKTNLVDTPYAGAPKTGVFASRSPVRPNPLALSTARIINIDRESSCIEISVIDAFDKTPVIDLKPYIPSYNCVEEFKVPDWVSHWEEWFREEDYSGSDSEIVTSEADVSRLLNNYSSTNISEPVDIIHNTMESEYEVYNDNIFIKGARQNNLKNISVEIPRHKITVITGLSGSGKSTLAYDTLYAESQRRLMNSLSSSGSSLNENFEKPDFDQIINLSPAVAVKQKPISKNIRSTVGTYTEMADYLRLIFAKTGKRHCPDCGKAIVPLSINEITKIIGSLPIDKVEFHSLNKSEFYELDKNSISESELKDTVQKYLDSSKGAFYLRYNGDDYLIQNREACYECNRSFFSLTPAHFSFNNPESMCPECKGLGVKMTLNPDRLISDPDKSILDSASLWWGDLRKFQKKPNANWMKGEVLALALDLNVDLEKPWKELPDEYKKSAIYGSNGREVSFTYSTSKGRSGTITRPVEGAVNIISRLMQNNGTSVAQNLYASFYTEEPCHICKGERLSRESRMVTVNNTRFPDLYDMELNELKNWSQSLRNTLSSQELNTVDIILSEMEAKIDTLIDVGLSYLTINRSVSTLSGGESQRLKLANLFGNELTDLVYILDEPTMNLCADNRHVMVDFIKRLRNKGNTVIAIEHNKLIMEAADYIIDIGPGAGKDGGEIVAADYTPEFCKNRNSVTAGYLRGDIGIEFKSSSFKPDKFIKIFGAKKHNLKSVNIEIPIATFTCVYGANGSGKSTLISQTLAPVLSYYSANKKLLRGDYNSIKGLEYVEKVISVTQSPIGRTPKSNPATYTGVLDEIRKIFAEQEYAKTRNFDVKHFSYNTKFGACEGCGGEGRKKVDMSFMPDVWHKCSDCEGKRYKNEILDVKYKNMSVADVLDMDINSAYTFFSEFSKIKRVLSVLVEVGLGYLKLGQSALTLSGGEAQRIKLAKELSRGGKGKTIYILDEPTTGLHFADVDQLLKLIFKLTAKGNTVIAIEHNDNFIKNADWHIEMGPGSGADGGEVVFMGRRQRSCIH